MEFGEGVVWKLNGCCKVARRVLAKSGKGREYGRMRDRLIQFTLCWVCAFVPACLNADAAAQPVPSGPVTATRELWVRKFERSPTFRRERWSHDLPARSLGEGGSNLRAGDFDCDGFADLAAYDRDSRTIYLALSNGRERFTTKAVGTLPSPLDWAAVTVRPPTADRCARLVVPEPNTEGYLMSELSEGGQLSWERRVLGADGGKLGPLLFSPELHGGQRRFFTLRPHADGSLGIGSIDEHGALALRSRIGLSDTFLGVAPLFEGAPSLPIFRPGGNAWAYVNDRERWITLLEAPKDLSWGREQLLDVNGDGISELLLPGADLQGTWIVFVYGTGAIAIPNRSLSNLLRSQTVAAHGDFHGTGRDDLLLLDDEGFVLLHPEPSPAVAGLSFLVNGEFVVSDAMGRLAAKLGDAATVRLSALDGAREIVQPEVERTLPKQSPFRVTVLVDTEVEGERGRILSLRRSNAQGPFVCGGFTDRTLMFAVGRTPVCPRGYAFQEMDDGSLPPTGTCCKLPQDDVLKEGGSWFKGSCPPQSVITAVDFVKNGADDPRSWSELLVRCTPVNPERYVLVEAEAGVSFGEGGASGQRSEERDRSDLPAALRAGYGRIELSHWDVDGCLGKSLGQLLVAVRGPRCEDMRFATLKERGASDAVTMYPACREMKDIYDPSRGCLAE